MPSYQSNAKRYLAKTVQNFVADVERNMGVQIFIMIAHKKADGTVGQQKYVFIISFHLYIKMSYKI